MSAATFFDAARALKREATENAGAGLTDAEIAALNAVIASWRPPTAPVNPTALTDAAAFFKSVRGAFGGLSQPQVSGFQALLQAFGVARWPLSWVAYGLATAWHETAARMEPVKEAYWLSEDWRKTHLHYFPWYGRGFCQLTWEANYKRADDELKLGGSLVADPDRALEPEIAAEIIRRGMEFGWFVRKALKDYLPLSGSAGFDAYCEARRIINGTDKAQVIAKEAQQFEAALIAGEWK
jgi:putative chitinase